MFYVIKCINKDNQRGYLIERGDTISFSIDAITADIKQFQTEKDARKVIKDRKIERKGVKAYIRTNEDLIADQVKGIHKQETDLFYVFNLKGEKCFFDTTQEGYYFDNPEFGFCIWKTERDAKDFIDAAGFPFECLVGKVENKSAWK